MTGINKKRLFVWGAIFCIFLLVGGGGYALNYMGYGNAGKIRQEVTDYINKFNALDQVKAINNDEKRHIKATLSSKGIMVDYKNNVVNSKLEFSYNIDNANTEYLETVYNKSESSSEEIVKLMIDAVGLQNGNAEGSIFRTFDYNDFYNTTLSQGVKISSTGNNVKVQINMNANVLSETGGQEQQGENNEYVIIEDYDREFKTFALYTVPGKFVENNRKHELSTDNNTCIAEFKVLSKDNKGKDAKEIADMIAKGENTTVETQNVNDTNWYKVSYPYILGGKTNRYLADANGSTLLFEYYSYYGTNNECDEYLDTILNSIKLN